MEATFRRASFLGAAACLSVVLAPGSLSLAGVAGSKHDFSAGAAAPGGVCVVCHAPHYGSTPALWPRDLSEETTYFSQTANPNYVRGDTILCYDCHDNHGTVDNDPPDSFFFMSRLAQDVAFDDDLKTTSPRDGLPADDKLGYYEKPTSGTVVSGHYVKNPPGSLEIRQGDKLPCNDCHDPHDTVNQAFIRTKLADKTLTGVKASTFMAYAETADGRNDADSRKFCIACHGTSEQTSDTAVTFAMVNPQYGSNRIAVPPTLVGAHGSASAVACVSCHKHSGTVASCKDCHGGGIAAEGNANIWPDGSGYPNRPGAHAAHIDAIAAARFGSTPTTAEKNATCDTCHPNPGSAGHDTNTAGSLPDTADVHRDPQNPTTHFTTIAGMANGVPTESYDNTAAAGGKDCQNVDCHYRTGTPVAGAATADGDGWFQPLAVASCLNCHGDGTAGTTLPDAHQRHVGTLTTQKGYACWYCHPSGVGNAGYSLSHQTGTVEWDFANTLDPGGSRAETYAGLASGTTAVKYGTGAASTCAGVYCHIQASPPWNGAIAGTACTLCHLTGQTAAPNPSSGLHYGSAPPTVSGAWHDETLDAVNGCAVCHTGVRTQGTHVDGAFDGGAVAGDVARMGLFSAYAQTADGVGTCSGSGVGAAGCHDQGDGGTWSRRWDAAVSYETTGSECGGCHGGLGLPTDTPAYGWTFGTTHNAADGATEHAYDWDGDARPPEVMSSHQACRVCHGANSATDTHANYVAGTAFWRGNAGDTTSMHGDGNVQMNGPAPSSGAGYDPAVWGCGNVPACHGNEWAGGSYPTGAGHRLDDSGWPVATVDFGGAACDSCHGYPPTGQETPAPFLDHGSRSPGASTAGNFLAAHGDCSTCHGVRGNANSPPDDFVYSDLTAQGGDAYTADLHKDGSVQINGISAPDNQRNADYQIADGGCARACHAATWRIGASYPTAAVKSLREFGSGSCESCHGGGIAAEGNANIWPDGLGVAPKGNQYPNRPGWHTNHVDAIAAVRFGAAPTPAEKNTTCDTCHPDPGGAGHNTNTAGSLSGTADVHRDPQNQTTHFRNVAGAVNGVPTESYDNTVDANGKSCQNVDCHYRAASPVRGTATASGDGWFQPLAIAGCPKCHGDGTAGVALPDAHQRHVGTLPTQKSYACWYCHPSGSGNADYSFSHQTGVVEWDFTDTLDPGGSRTETYAGLAAGTTAVKYGTGAASACTGVYCHIQASPPWNGAIAATGCTLCHQTGEIDAPNPSSGLHYGGTPPTVSGTWHDETLEAVNGCAACHTAVRTEGTHVDGTFNGGAGDASRMGLFAAYTQTADGVGTCSGAAVGVAGCHDGGDGGSWSRLWDASVGYETNGSECRGCHGGFAADWTFGTGAHNATDASTEHGYNWDGDAAGPEVMTRHLVCKTCHGMNSAADRSVNYFAINFWDPTGARSMHGDGKIQLNGPSPATGAGYNSANRGCDNALCHGGASSLHNLEASGWPVEAVDFGGAACDSCHGYPPTGTETPTPFLDHGSRTPGATDDAGFLSAHLDCATCHGVRGNTNTPPDGFVFTDLTARGGDAYTAALHLDGSVQVNGISAPDNSQNANYQLSDGGCTRACHVATWMIDTSYPTAAGKSLMEFGSGVCESCHDGTVPLAPNVMTYWSGSTFGQDGGHGDPDGAPALACVDCHDLSQPTAPDSARHGTGTYNSIWANNSTRSSNTAHLKAAYFTEFPANAAGRLEHPGRLRQLLHLEMPRCEQESSPGDDRTREVDAALRRTVPPGGANEWSVEFGTHLTGPPSSLTAANGKRGHGRRSPDRRRFEHGCGGRQGIRTLHQLPRSARHGYPPSPREARI